MVWYQTMRSEKEPPPKKTKRKFAYWYQHPRRTDIRPDINHSHPFLPSFASIIPVVPIRPVPYVGIYLLITILFPPADLVTHSLHFTCVFRLRTFQVPITRFTPLFSLCFSHIPPLVLYMSCFLVLFPLPHPPWWWWIVMTQW